MSARPGLCGGHRATGVPTAINSNLAVLACRDPASILAGWGPYPGREKAPVLERRELGPRLTAWRTRIRGGSC
jgi:hypothetical protein